MFAHAPTIRTDDRRTDTRLEDLDIAATVLVRHNPPVSVSIENVSVGGALLVGALSVATGDRVQILFEVDDHPVDVTAEVIRVEHLDMLADRFAVRFSGLAANARQAIERLVAKAIERECAELEHDVTDVTH